MERYHQIRSVGHQPFRAACYAPFVAMSIDMNGLVSVCSFTRVTPLGRIGDIPLMEMWNGARVQQMREALVADDLSYACNRCAEEIEGGNLHGVLATGFDQFRAVPDPPWPTRIEFALSTRCNLQCIMCSGEFSSAIRTRREGLPLPVERFGDAFLAELDPFLPHLEQARFLGGEPFLAEINFRIWERMIELGLDVDCNVTTNGTCWTPRIRRVLAALPFSVGVSIDGTTPETVEAVRAGASFEAITENLAHFVDYRDRTGNSLSLTFCLMVQNWHEFVDYLVFADQLDCQVFVNTVRQPPQFSLYELPEAELRRVVQQLELAAASTGSELHRNATVLQEQLSRLRQHLDDVDDDPAWQARVDRLARYSSLLQRIVAGGSSDADLLDILAEHSPDAEVSVVECDASDVIIGGTQRYVGLELRPLIGTPATNLNLVLAGQFGNDLQVLAARSGNGVSARVMSFSSSGSDPLVVMTVTSAGRGAGLTTRYGVAIDGRPG